MTVDPEHSTEPRPESAGGDSTAVPAPGSSRAEQATNLPPSVVGTAPSAPRSSVSPRGRRGLGQLAIVAVAAAALASGGTYAATRYVAPPAASSPAAAVTTQGNGSSSPQVVQGSATAPDWTATAKAVSPSVVSITVTSNQAQGQGSGVVLGLC